MRKTLFALFLLSLLARVSCAAAPSAQEKAGREAFIRLKCVACHRVLGDPGLPAPIAAEPAPILGGLNAEHSSDELVQAITEPSRSFAPGFHPSSSGKSRMGNMADSMTLQQLRDIAAYLKGQEESEGAWKKEGP